MDTNGDTANVRPTGIAFVNCSDATTICRIAYMTAREDRQLRGLLAALHGAGLILAAGYAQALPDCGYREVADDIRRSIGAHIVDAFLTASDEASARQEPAPAAVMPVWAFEPEGGSDDVLVSSARLWGSTSWSRRCASRTTTILSRWPRCANGSGAGPRRRQAAPSLRPPGYLAATAAT